MAQKNKIIFNVTDKHYNILLLKDNEITEYRQEKKDSKHVIGDIFLGIVEKTMPSLNAAFVDIGHEKGAFLHYSDLSPRIQSIKLFILKIARSKKPVNISKLELAPATDKHGKITSVLKKGQKVLVQVTKEVIQSKGIRVSSVLALTGKYIILFPFSNEVTISKKIKNAIERARLTKLMASIKPDNFGIMVRTVAEGKEVAVLAEELKRLKKKWEEGMGLLLTSNPKQKLIGEFRAIASITKDLYGEDLDTIMVDDLATYTEIHAYVKEILPEHLGSIHLYEGETNIFQYLGIHTELQNLLSPIVAIEGGGYLIVEQTQAFYSIDVNSGNYLEQYENQNIPLDINLAATKLIVRLLTLCNMGGNIIIDYISMDSYTDRQKVYQTAKKLLQNSSVRTDLLPLSKFSIMEITRQRVRPSITIDNGEVCLTCYGSGKTQPNETILKLLEEQLKLLILKHKLRNLTVCIHPYLYAYLHQGFIPKQWKWFLNYWQRIRIVQDNNLAIADYRILNKEKEVIADNPELRIHNKKYNPLSI